MKVFTWLLLAVCVVCVAGEEAEVLDGGGMAEIGPLLAPQDPAFEDLEKMKAQYHPDSPEFAELTALSDSTSISSDNLGTRITPKKVAKKATPAVDDSLAGLEADDAQDIQDEAREMVAEQESSQSAHTKHFRSESSNDGLGMGADLLVSSKPESLFCDNCRVVMLLVLRALKDVKPAGLTTKQVRDAFLKASHQIPAFVGAPILAEDVEMQLQGVVTLLQGGTVDPKVLCERANLCAKPSKPSPFTPDTRCEMCELVMTVVDDQIESRGASSKPSGAAIPVLNTACALLPSVLRAECGKFLKHHGASLLQALLADKHPVKVCHEASMCVGATPSSKTGIPASATTDMSAEETLSELQAADSMGIGIEVDRVRAEVIKPTKKDDVKATLEKPTTAKATVTEECLLCNLLLRFESVGEEAKKPISSTMALDTVCSTLPHAWTQKCHAYVAEHGAKLLKTTPQYANKEYVCRRMHRCGASQ